LQIGILKVTILKRIFGNDLIKVDEELLEVIEINSDSTGDNYFIEYIDTYGERDTLILAHDAYVDLYVYVDLDE